MTERLASILIVLFIALALCNSTIYWYNHPETLSHYVAPENDQFEYKGNLNFRDTKEVLINKGLRYVFVKDSPDVITQVSTDTSRPFYKQTLNHDCMFWGDYIPCGAKFEDISFRNFEISNCLLGYTKDTLHKRYSLLPEISIDKSKFNTLVLSMNTYDATLEFWADSFMREPEIEPTKDVANNRVMTDISFSACTFLKGIHLKDSYKNSGLPASVDFTFCEIFGVMDISNLQLGLDKIHFFEECRVDTINMSNSRIINRFTLSNVGNRTRTAEWAFLTPLRFLLQPYFETRKLKKVYINLTGVDISKIEMDFQYFELYFINETFDQKHSAYRALIEKFRQEGKYESEKLVTIAYRNFQGGIANLCSKLWWNYGYSKGRVFLWAIVLLLVFTIGNRNRLDYFKDSVYNIERIPHIAQLSEGRQLWYSFIYTAIIFFSLKIDMDKLHFEKRNSVIYLLTIYLTGILCLAYMANFVLSS